jgi:aldehyde dehydrogenase (NAD+)
MRKWAALRYVETPILVGPGLSYIRPEPLGVIAVLSAWNYPIYTLLGPVVGVISAGNCCLIKPSELAPNSSAAITKLIEKYLDPKFFKV